MKSPFGNRLKKQMEAREAVMIPTYTLEKKHRKIPRSVLIITLVVLLIFVTIYLPPMVCDEVDIETHSSVDVTSIANPIAMEWASTYLRNNPDGDFDGDGVSNEAEVTYGSGVYLPDNDFDGSSDYAELYILDSNPTIPDDSIETYVRQSDLATGNSVNTPFRLHGIIMWADDYYSKARGGVVELIDGSYNFFRFSGWVQFPDSPVAAYKVVNGVQEELEKNDSGYFYIEAENDVVNVRTYAKQPEKCHILSILGNRYSLPDNLFTRFMSMVLPSHGMGLLVCRPALANDIDDTWTETATANPVVTFDPGEYSELRFGRNDLSLDNLANIFTQIDSGNNVVISLMSHDVGEVILEVYGYTSRGNLLVCVPETGENLGVINIDIISERVLDRSGGIANYEHFEFEGCGYSSAARHRLAILDYVSDATVPTEEN